MREERFGKICSSSNELQNQTHWAHVRSLIIADMLETMGSSLGTNAGVDPLEICVKAVF